MLNTLKFSRNLYSKILPRCKIIKQPLISPTSVLMEPNRTQSQLPLIKERAYVGGEWVCAASEKVFTVFNPAHGTPLAKVPDMEEHDVELAIKAASKAFKEWRNTTAYERSVLMKKWYDLMVQHEETIAQIITLECGKPIAESMGEVRYGNSYIEFYAEEARRINGEILQSTFRGKKYFVEKQPIGVAGLITAYNFPLAMVSRKVAAAVAAGCTCVVKPNTETPLTALAMAELAQDAGIPKGVINVITSSHASNPIVVDFLCRHPDVRGISFTGSVQIGKIVNEKCAPLVKRVSLELGGNAPFIVYNSANVDTVVRSAINAKFRSSGQTCVAPNRFLIQDGIYDCFIDNLAIAMRNLKLGDGIQDDVKIGPLINTAQLEKIRQLVDDAVSKGANVVLGGKRAPNIGDLYYEPTILTDVRETMKIYTEEIFGPIVSVVKFRTEEESLFIANNVDVGLAGYIFSEDISQIFRVSKQLEVGMVGVNEGIISAAEIPFGGVKQSGIGREGSHHGIQEFIDYKYVCIGSLNM